MQRVWPVASHKHSMPPWTPHAQAIRGVAQERARRHLAAAAGELRAMRGAFELCAARVRGVALDAEMRLLQLGVPMLAGGCWAGQHGQVAC